MWFLILLSRTRKWQLKLKRQIVLKRVSISHRIRALLAVMAVKKCQRIFCLS